MIINLRFFHLLININQAVCCSVCIDDILLCPVIMCHCQHVQARPCWSGDTSCHTELRGAARGKGSRWELERTTTRIVLERSATLVFTPRRVAESSVHLDDHVFMIVGSQNPN